MPTKHYEGRSTPIQQVSTVTVGSNTNAQVFSINAKHPCGSISTAIEIATFTASSSSTTDIATALAAAWNASNHPYAKGVNGIGGATATSSVAIVTITANTAGIPIVLTVTGNTTGTLTLATSTANSGPEDLSVAGNYAEGSVVAASDNLIFENIPNLSIKYGLGMTATLTGGLTVINCGGVFGSPGCNLQCAPSSVLWDTNSLGYLDIGSATISPRIVRTGGYPFGLYIIGTAMVNMRIDPGASVAVAAATGDVSTFTGSVENAGNCLIGPAVTMSGGSAAFKNLQGGRAELRVGGALTLLENNSDETDVWDYGLGARTTVTNNGFGTIYVCLPGSASRTITNLNGYDGSVDFTNSRVANVVTNSSRHRACSFLGDINVVSFANATSEFGSTSRSARFRPISIGGGAFGTK